MLILASAAMSDVCVFTGDGAVMTCVCSVAGALPSRVGSSSAVQGIGFLTTTEEYCKLRDDISVLVLDLTGVVETQASLFSMGYH